MDKEYILQLERKELYSEYLTFVMKEAKQAQELVVELRETSRYEDDFVFRIYIDFSKVLTHHMLGELEQALQSATSLIELAGTMELREIVSYCYYIIASVYFAEGLYENTYEFANRCFINEERYGLNDLKALALRLKALVHMRFDDHETAAELVKRAIGCLEETKDVDPRYSLRCPAFISLYLPILAKLNRVEEMHPIMCELEEQFKGQETPNYQDYYVAQIYYNFAGKKLDVAKTYFDKLVEMAGDNVYQKFELINFFCTCSVLAEVDLSFFREIMDEGFAICKQHEFLQSMYFFDLVVTVAQNSNLTELYQEALPLFTESLKKKILDDTKARLHSFEVLEANQYRVSDFEEVESKNIELKRVAEEAIRHKNEVEEMNKRIQFVHSLGRKLTTSLDIKEVVDMIYVNLKENVPLTTFFIVLSDKKNRLLRSLTYYEWNELRPNFVIPIDSENSMVAECYRDASFIMINNLDIDQRYASKLLVKIGKGATKSAIFTPLIVGDEVVAVCSLQYHEPNVYTDAHRAFLEELTPYLAVAINNANKSTELANEISSHKKTQENLLSANARLEMLSAIDGLTQISNRRDFETRVLSMLDESISNQVPISIFMFDLDYFKSFNDTYGHLEGDEALKTVARMIRKHLDEVNGLSARFGGEEFIAACQGLNEQESIRLANRIRDDIYERNILHEKSPIGRLTISVGVAISSHNKHVMKSDIMRWADISLYQAKNTGKNKAVIKVVVEGEELPSGLDSQYPSP